MKSCEMLFKVFINVCILFRLLDFCTPFSSIIEAYNLFILCFILLKFGCYASRFMCTVSVQVKHTSKCYCVNLSSWFAAAILVQPVEYRGWWAVIIDSEFVAGDSFDDGGAVWYFHRCCLSKPLETVALLMLLEKKKYLDLTTFMGSEMVVQHAILLRENNFLSHIFSAATSLAIFASSFIFALDIVGFNTSSVNMRDEKIQSNHTIDPLCPTLP